jgi:hypothetical protein
MKMNASGLVIYAVFYFEKYDDLRTKTQFHLENDLIIFTYFLALLCDEAGSASMSSIFS